VLDELGVAKGGELLLRGGTALNLLHLGAPRLSVDLDLDLDYVGAADVVQAKPRRPELLREIERLAIEAGYHVEHMRPSYAMAHLLLRYQNVSGRGEPLCGVCSWVPRSLRSASSLRSRRFSRG
jgi:hypothetical protein